MKQKYITLLGLTQNEARIVQVLNHVPRALSEIEGSARLSHASVVDSLKRLVKRDVVNVVHSSKRKAYTCDVDTLFTRPTPATRKKHGGVEIYEGKDALLSLISKELVRHKHGRLLSFHGVGVALGWRSILGASEIQRRNELIVEYDIIVERFVPQNGYRTFFKGFPKAWQETMIGRTHITHFLPDEYFRTRTELMMFSDVVMVYETHRSRIIIFRDKETIMAYEALFEMMRTIGVRINSEEEFQKYLRE